MAPPYTLEPDYFIYLKFRLLGYGQVCQAVDYEHHSGFHLYIPSIYSPRYPFQRLQELSLGRGFYQKRSPHLEELLQEAISRL